jgi:CyaY protein
MNPNEFESRADAMLEKVARAVEESGVDCDCEPKGSGVLEIEFADRSRIIVNRHSAAQEIWVAAKSGGHHFHFDGSAWVHTRDGRELIIVLSALIAAQSSTASRTAGS